MGRRKCLSLNWGNPSPKVAGSCSRFRLQIWGIEATAYYKNGGAENATLEFARLEFAAQTRSKMQGWKMRNWKI